MTYPSFDAGGVQPVTPAPHEPEPVELPAKRPAAVTGAAVLMVMMTIVVTMSAAGMLYMFGTLGDNTTGPEDAEAYRTFRAVLIGVSVVYLLVGLLVICLTIAILRGRNWARVTTFCVYAVFMLCAGFGEMMVLIVGGTSASMQGSASEEDVTFTVAGSLVMGTQLLAMIVTVVLLALPMANRWFTSYTRARAAGLL